MFRPRAISMHKVFLANSIPKCSISVIQDPTKRILNVLIIKDGTLRRLIRTVFTKEIN